MVVYPRLEVQIEREVSVSNLIIVGVASFIVGGAISFFARRMIASRKLRLAEEEAKKILAEAEAKRKEMLLGAKEEVFNIKATAEAEVKEYRSELQRQGRRLSQKEENLERRAEALERREYAISAKEKQVEGLYTKAEEVKKKQLEQLELISTMSSAEAKELLLQRTEAEVREEMGRRLREIEARLKEESSEKAQRIIAQAIQRCTTEVVAETITTVVPLPSDEMKGRLIGREGRNIRALEHATGVELIIDDTPETVTLSCFDPVRREIARIAINKLILDGRIHPPRIEEMVGKAREEVEAIIQAEGEEAPRKVGVSGLNPELIKMLGRLKYRTSYGQNVLAHSIEVALLSGMMAGELGARVSVAKRAGLLHDIGKGVSPEVEGTHALIGADIARQWGESPQVAEAIAEHHGEKEITTVEGFIVSAADAISGARPGARRESLEQYLKRVEALESIANSFPSVERSYAIQAGREIRIMVKPEEIDDVGAMRLARDIAKKIEETLSYPGQIKITIIRETRAIDYAK